MADYRDYAAEEAERERKRIVIIKQCIWNIDGDVVLDFGYTVHGPQGYDDMDFGSDGKSAYLEWRLRRLEQDAGLSQPKPTIERRA